ncbi:MAG: lysophospholipid acyltransferase family protein [Prevotella sp.]|nr:lysophospholipid acyltransferase family protein [Prevotella sp.]
MKNIAYYLLYALVYPLSLLPFRILYLISDGFFLLVYHVIGYRRKIVRKNLTASFPDKRPDELRTIERQFYHWLCDYFVETIKLLTISDERLLQHIEFRGVEQLEACYDQGQDCAAILGHYCNWEWLSATGLAFKRYPQAVMGLIYHPLYNAAFDRLFVAIRSAHGGDCIPKKDILRHMIRYRQEDRRTLFGYISDQTPKWENIHLWLPFLHQETPVFTGGERIMKKTDNAVFYTEMERPRRGQYICTFRLISAHAAQEPESEITRRFFQLLEETIRKAPAYYLWTHNRWKRTKEEFDRRFRIENGHTISK